MGSEATEQYSLKSNKVVPPAPRVGSIDVRCNGHHILIICVEARCLGHENLVRLLRRGSGRGRANIARELIKSCQDQTPLDSVPLVSRKRWHATASLASLISGLMIIDCVWMGGSAADDDSESPTSIETNPLSTI